MSLPTAQCPACGWITVGRLTGCLNCGTPLAHPQSAAAPAPAQQTPAWQATHEVPRRGLQAWATPDAASPPVAELGAHTELQLLEVLGAWARVAASNGWTGWVDARELKQKG